MNFAAHSGVVSRALRIGLVAAAGIALLGISGCKPAEPVRIDDLRMPLEAFSGAQRMETKSVADRILLEDARPAEGSADNVVLKTLEREQVSGSAYWRYWVSADRSGLYKVRTTLYDSVEARRLAWEKRYAPPALSGTEVLALGDGGFLYQNRIAGFFHGPMMVEISTSGTADRLRDFAGAYAEFVQDQLRS